MAGSLFPKARPYYFPCRYCDWAWKVHYWLPFDHSIGGWVYRWHMRGHLWP